MRTSQKPYSGVFYTMIASFFRGITAFKTDDLYYIGTITIQNTSLFMS